MWESLVDPHRPGARPWLDLRSDEVEPGVVEAEKPGHVVWSSLWPSRPNDLIEFELLPDGDQTRLGYKLLTPDEPPDESTTSHLRRRMSELLYADLRHSYGQ